jgi:tetratricopeptide (TPR) repeat protein
MTASGWRFRLLVAGALAASVSTGLQALAQGPGQSAPDAAHKAAAAEHFKKAREFYKQGAYREAITELEAALQLDPDAKLLVYNLGIVHERLGNIDDALRYFHRYEGMNLTPDERDKCEASIRRLEGAKKELEEKEAEQARQNAANQQPPPTPETPPPAPSRGRIDALTITTGVVAVIGLGMGTYFGVEALSQSVGSGYSVSPNPGQHQSDYQSQQDDAHRDAIRSDVCFGVGAAAAVGTLLLYFLRPAVVHPPPATGTSLSAAPTPGGATMLLRGSF